MDALQIILGAIPYFIIGSVFAGLAVRYNRSRYYNEEVIMVNIIMWPIAFPLIVIGELCWYIISKIGKV